MEYVNATLDIMPVMTSDVISASQAIEDNLGDNELPIDKFSIDKFATI